MSKSITLGHWLVLGSVTLAIGCGADPETTTTEGETAEPAVLRDSLGRELGPISAAIVRANREADRTMNLVARVESRPNEMVEFYEPAPGKIMIMGAGAPDPLLIRESAPVEYKGDVESFWKDLTHDADMPQALGTAVARLPAKRPEIARDVIPPSSMPGMPDPLAPHRPPPTGLDETAHLTSDWCDSSYYTASVSGYGVLGSCHTGYYSWNVCRDHRTNNAFAEHEDAVDMKANVCPYRGNVTFKVSADEDWITEGTYTVLRNSYRWKTVFEPECAFDPFDDCPTVRIDILDASGDGYQWRYQTAEE